MKIILIGIENVLFNIINFLKISKLTEMSDDIWHAADEPKLFNEFYTFFVNRCRDVIFERKILQPIY